MNFYPLIRRALGIRHWLSKQDAKEIVIRECTLQGWSYDDDFLVFENLLTYDGIVNATHKDGEIHFQIDIRSGKILSMPGPPSLWPKGGILDEPFRP